MASPRSAPLLLATAALLLVLLSLSARPASAQTEPYIITKARLTRSAAINATRDWVTANTTATTALRSLNTANLAFSQALATFNDAAPLVRRLQTLVATRQQASLAAAAAIAPLQTTLEEESDKLSRMLSQGTDEVSLAQAVEDAKRRVGMTTQLVDDQEGEVADARGAALEATRKAADSNLTGTEAAEAQARLTEAMTSKTMAETILVDMVKQADRAKTMLAKRQEAMDNPSSVQAAINAQQNTVDNAQMDVDEAIAREDAAKAAVLTAQKDVAVANASIPTKSANVSNTRILLSKANTTWVSANSSNVTMFNRMVTSSATAASAEKAARDAGYTWTW